MLLLLGWVVTPGIIDALGGGQRLGHFPGIVDAIRVSCGPSPGAKMANGKTDLWRESGRLGPYCGNARDGTRGVVQTRSQT